MGGIGNLGGRIQRGAYREKEEEEEEEEPTHVDTEA